MYFNLVLFYCSGNLQYFVKSETKIETYARKMNYISLSHFPFKYSLFPTTCQGLTAPLCNNAECQHKDYTCSPLPLLLKPALPRLTAFLGKPEKI